MKKIVFLIAFFGLFYTNSNAQQDPHYTQYMYNMNVINPAYAGSKESISGALLYRQQWVGLEGAPKTTSFALHSPVGKNVGLGVSVISDKIGPVNENNVYADFSYKLNLGNDNKLLFGLKTGTTFQQVGLFSNIGNGFVQNPSDLAFSENTSNMYFNFGAGVFYHSENYYVGVSMPNFLQTKHLSLSRDGDFYNFGNETQHYFITGGYVFEYNDFVKLKPSFMLKSAVNVPISADFSGNVLLYDKFEIGATYRLEDSFGAMVNFAVTPNLRIGYAYDSILSDLKAVAPSSHEIMLLFDLNLYKKVSISPRFF
jgi:type IX secretion system PorP/SprF family membrane protein